ncbi:G-D-S-L family lipolytic protein [Zopfochytrium polystomum]|nr:G-D-S-L family lipolytic protein [Zopfochytrium polystomum]
MRFPTTRNARLTAGSAAAAVVTVLAASAVTAVPTPAGISTVVAFGDSWSDIGNAYNLTNGVVPLSPPYYKGRFSNGPVWLETLVDDSHLDTKLVDLAFGAATTNSAIRGILNTGAPAPSVNEQIAIYYSAYLNSNSVGDSPLYSLWSGGNDLYFDFVVYKVNTTSEQIASNIILNAQTLITNFSANRILILNLPPVTRFPLFKVFDANLAALAAQITAGINALLPGKIDALVASSSAAPQILLFDASALVTSFLDNPADYGFTNAVDPCLDTTTGVACANPDAYVFWDNLHYTAKAHRLIGEAVAKKVQGWVAGN